jgi:uncharacterized membrane protein YfcA
LTLPPESIAIAALIVAAAYVVYGLTGFGSGIIAMPLVVLFLPLKLAVTMLMLMDIVAGTILVGGHRRHVCYSEAALITPFMLVGMAFGVFLLVNLPERPLLLGLGLFVITYAAFGLLHRGTVVAPLGPAWGAILACLGGALVALYNVGAVLWVFYLATQISRKEELRATMAATLLLSVVARAVMYGHAGLLDDVNLWFASGAMLVPTLSGYYLGNILHSKVSVEAFRRGINLVLLLSGTMLLLRSA